MIDRIGVRIGNFAFSAVLVVGQTFCALSGVLGGGKTLIQFIHKRESNMYILKLGISFKKPIILCLNFSFQGWETNSAYAWMLVGRFIFALGGENLSVT